MMRPTRSKTELRSAEKSNQNRAFQWESVNEQEERANKTMRLRALHLAKEAAEKATAKAKVPAKKARLIMRRQASKNSAAAIPGVDPAGS